MALSITAQQEALSSPLSSHAHRLPCQKVQRSKVVCISPLVLCLQYWKVPKKCNTTDLRSPKQHGDRKSTTECTDCHILQPGGCKEASWCSSLLCTGLHPAHHPRKNRRGLVSPALPSEAISGFLCSLHLLKNMQGNPYTQQDLVTVTPCPGPLWSKNSAFSI